MGALLEAIAASGNGDDFASMEQAVEDGTGGGHVAQEFSPFFNRAVGGHKRRAVFVPAHNDFQKDLAAFWRQHFQSHSWTGYNPSACPAEIALKKTGKLSRESVKTNAPPESDDGSKTA